MTTIPQTAEAVSTVSLGERLADTDAPIPYELTEAVPCALAWCEQRGVHVAHSSATVAIPSPSHNSQDGPYLGAFLLETDKDRVVAGFDAGQWQDLDAAGLRAEIAKIREHLPRLEAMAAQLEAIETGSQDSAPAADGPRTFTVHKRESEGGGEHVETCPSWCRLDHEADTVGREFLEDIWHVGPHQGIEVALSDSNEPAIPWTALDAKLAVIPHTTDPSYRVPHVQIQFVEEVWCNSLGPDELADLVEKIAGQVERLRTMHGELVAARAEWEAGR